MAKIEKTITVQVCDACGREQHCMSTCFECGKDLCNHCMMFFTVEVIRQRVERHAGTVESLCILDRKVYFDRAGQSTTYCPEHAEPIQERLREAGLKDFSYQVTPV